jgi:ubiquinone/menaquinone biosynthesis C-methylase UbiE
MSSSTSQYGPGHAASQVKHHEWRTAENSAAHLVPHLERAAKTNPHLKLLDVGAGSGTISASLAKYIPQGHVTATDISQDILDRAAEYAKLAGLTNLAFQTASVYELPFDDATFDIAHAHQVLCHLGDPARAIKEMVRVVKPGGIVALRESDMQMWCFWPELHGLTRFHEITVKTLLANGGQDKCGRKLVSWAVDAGIPRESMDASFGTWCYSNSYDRRSWGKL